MKAIILITLLFIGIISFSWIQDYVIRIEVNFDKAESKIIAKVISGKEKIEECKVYIKSKEGKLLLIEFKKGEIPSDGIVKKQVEKCPQPGKIFYEVKFNGTVFKNSTKGKTDLSKEGSFFEISD